MPPDDSEFKPIIRDLLFQGSRWAAGESGPTDLDLIVGCGYEVPPPPRKEPFGPIVVHLPLDDTEDWDWRMDSRARKRIKAVARLVAGAVQRGQRVLVTCNQGRNRSGLVTGLSLRMLGMSPRAALRRLRDAIPSALTNEVFEDAVRHMRVK